MKKLKELKFEELTLEQKAGLVCIGGCWTPLVDNPAMLQAHIDLIKKHELGVLYLCGDAEKTKKSIEIMREAADFPLVVVTDTKCLDYDHSIGNDVALGYINDEKTAYAYGKYVGIMTKAHGYDIVGSPMLDRTHINRPCGAATRTIHPNKKISARLAAAQARGMHDAGIMNYGKHYPSADKTALVDPHLAKAESPMTREELINDSLYAYKYLIDRGLLDATMPGHQLLPKIDPKYTAVLSRKVMDVLRDDLGFEGLCITDDLRMMGAVAKYGYEFPCWQSIEAGNDVVLSFTSTDISASRKAVLEAVKRGDLSMAQLDKAVKRVLEFQHKAYVNSQKPAVTMTPEEDELVRTISRRSIAAIAEEGVPTSLPTDAKHCFVVLTENDKKLQGIVESDSVSSTTVGYTEVLIKQIALRFPNSIVYALPEFPTPTEMARCCKAQLECDDTVFITFHEFRAFKGSEHLSWGVVSLLESLQVENRVKALIHFGNPFILDDLPKFPLVLNALGSAKAREMVIDILAGIYKPEGKIPYRLKKKK